MNQDVEVNVETATVTITAGSGSVITEENFEAQGVAELTITNF